MEELLVLERHSRFEYLKMQDAISIDTAAAWIPAWHPRLFRLARAVVYSDREAASVVQAAYLKLLLTMRPGTMPDDLARLLEDSVFLGAMRERVRFRGQLLQLLDAAAGAQPAIDTAATFEESQPRGRRALPGDPRKPGDIIVDSLSDMLRVVFVMLDVIGMSVPEAARMLHIQEATVESRAQRARALVSEQMKEMGIRKMPEFYEVSAAQCRAAAEHLRVRATSHRDGAPAALS
jgi:DNA-directed RNA polymerase specialized sigma24 family protein